MGGHRSHRLVLLLVAVMIGDLALASQASPEKVLVASVGRVSVFRPTGTPRAVFVSLHGIQSNGTWYEPLGRELAKRGFALWAYTRPNTVLKPGEKPVADAASWEEWLTQLESVGQKARVKDRPLIAMGVSWGARPVLASIALHPYFWDGGIVLNPALKTRKDFSFAMSALFAGAPFSRIGTFKIPLTLDDYTNNENTRRHWLGDAELTRRCTNRFFGRTVALRRYADHKLDAIQKPLLALLGGDDNLVPHDSVRSILTGANNSRITVDTVGLGTHCMLLEQTPSVADRVAKWVTSRVKASQ